MQVNAEFKKYFEKKENEPKSWTIKSKHFLADMMDSFDARWFEYFYHSRSRSIGTRDSPIQKYTVYRTDRLF